MRPAPFADPVDLAGLDGGRGTSNGIRKAGLTRIASSADRYPPRSPIFLASLIVESIRPSMSSAVIDAGKPGVPVQ